MTTTGPHLRYLAARIINDVTDGRSLTEALDAILQTVKEPRDRAFVQAVCYGVCRYYSRLDVLLSHLLKKPMNAKDGDIHALLLVGLYQLIDMRVPAHAAVSETVNASEKFKKPWARGLINAVLREYQRSHAQIEESMQDDEEAVYAHPAWWITMLQKAWPEQWQTILTANNERPPFSLRVNQSHSDREAYIARLAQQMPDANVQIISETVSGITLDPPVHAEELPGFAAGDISVQDGAAQLSAELLDLAEDQRVLDACAAPGGKLTHILEIQPNLSSCVAIEKDAARLSSIKENLHRLKQHATIICDDAANIDVWWDKEQFDRILLDAPCSASGVIRRHPDIKLLRQPTDIKALAAEQLRLLTALWPLLKPGGKLLYVTCSVFPQENVETLKKFLAAHSDAQEEKIKASWGLACDIGRQILPGMHGMDGFYFACLRK